MVCAMVSAADIDQKIEKLEQLLARKCGAKRGGLSRRAHKAARYLSARTKRQIASLEEARQLVGHPRLAQRLDGATLQRAYEDAVAQINTVDRKDVRKGFWLGLLGSLAFNLILAFAIFLVVLGLRGFLS